MVTRTNRYVFQVHICVIQVQPFEQALLLRCSCKQSKPIKVCSVLVCHKEINEGPLPPQRSLVC